MLAAKNPVEIRHELLDRLGDGPSTTLELFELVKPEFLYERPIRERHRIIFYLGHLESFDWNLLRERLLGSEAFHPEFDRLFAFGIDPVGGGLPSDQPGGWPSLDEVRRYKGRVRESLDAGLEKVISGYSGFDGQEHASATQLLNVAIEHRLMHAETFTYMLHQLPLAWKKRKQPTSTSPALSVIPKMIEIPIGSVTLGLSRAGNVFGWGNEYESKVVQVPAFAIDRYKVTNGQFLEFMAAGGYDNRALWSEADWNWKTERDISFPSFWRRTEDQ